MTNLDKRVLFTYLRKAPFGGRLRQKQVEGVELIIRTFEELYPDADVRHVANCLAQVYLETGGRMEPVRETFAASDWEARRNLDKAWKSGQLTWVTKNYWKDNYFGRGFIQITHKVNYHKLGLRLGLDLVGNPSLALDPKIAARIAVVGMMEGLFVSGHSLPVYFNDTTDDAIGARRIVNGTNKAKLIASYHYQIVDAIEKALTSTFEELPDALPSDPVADPLAPSPIREPGQTGSLLAFLVSLLGLGSSDSFGGGNVFFWLLLASVVLFVFLYWRKNR